MFEYLAMRLFHVTETVKMNGLRSLLNEVIYTKRIAVPVEMDLSGFKPSLKWPNDNSFKCIEINHEVLDQSDYSYKFKNRKLKASRNIKKGLCGYGLLRNDEVIADLWYSSPTISPGSPEHKDLIWLGIAPRENYAYAFDMFLVPEMRGQNIATCFQGSFLLYLRDHGIDWAYGYYWADNLQALWVHRLLKWKELGKLKVSRFLVIKRVWRE